MSIHTVAFFANDQMVDRSVGALAKARLESRVEKVLDKLAVGNA